MLASSVTALSSAFEKNAFKPGLFCSCEKYWKRVLFMSVILVWSSSLHRILSLTNWLRLYHRLLHDGYAGVWASLACESEVDRFSVLTVPLTSRDMLVRCDSQILAIVCFAASCLVHHLLCDSLSLAVCDWTWQWTPTTGWSCSATDMRSVTIVKVSQRLIPVLSLTKDLHAAQMFHAFHACCLHKTFVSRVDFYQCCLQKPGKTRPAVCPEYPLLGGVQSSFHSSMHAYLGQLWLQTEREF